jgi:hypothetical protein
VLHPVLGDTVISAGQSIEQLGVLTPVTVTLKLHVAGSPPILLVSQLTAVVPTGKLEPEGGTQVAGGAGQLSFKVGAKSTTALPNPGVVSLTVMSDGQVIAAGVESVTVTVKPHGAPVSATQMTGVAPMGKTEPDGGLQKTLPH